MCCSEWNAWDRAGTVHSGAGVTLAVAFGIRRVLLLSQLFALLSSPPWTGEDCTFLCTSGPQRYPICTCNSSLCSLGAPLLPSKNLSLSEWKSDYLHFDGKMREGWEKDSNLHRAVCHSSVQLSSGELCSVWGTHSERNCRRKWT